MPAFMGSISIFLTMPSDIAVARGQLVDDHVGDAGEQVSYGLGKADGDDDTGVPCPGGYAPNRERQHRNAPQSVIYHGEIDERRCLVGVLSAAYEKDVAVCPRS